MKINEHKETNFKESVTNQFMEITDNKQHKYLVRINGRLWAPFSRKAESYNLDQLRKKNIETGVLVNSPKIGLQICKLYQKENSLCKIMIGKNTNEDLLNPVGKEIKRIHQVKNYYGEYHLGSIISNSFKNIPDSIKTELMFFYKIIMRIALTISNIKEQHVFSHNDLLPSSIYFNDNHSNKQAQFVDFEYSGANHRGFDLTYISEKSQFDSLQEQQLIEGYDPKSKLNIQYELAILKPAIHFLWLTCWGAKALEKIDLTERHARYNVLKDRIEKATLFVAHRSMINHQNFGFFSQQRYQPRDYSKNNFMQQAVIR